MDHLEIAKKAAELAAEKAEAAAEAAKVAAAELKASQPAPLPRRPKTGAVAKVAVEKAAKAVAKKTTKKSA